MIKSKAEALTVTMRFFGQYNTNCMVAVKDQAKNVEYVYYYSRMLLIRDMTLPAEQQVKLIADYDTLSNGDKKCVRDYLRDIEHPLADEPFSQIKGYLLDNQLM